MRRRVIFSVIRVFPAAKHRAEVVELLHSVQDLARPSPGCFGCWVSEEDYPHQHIRYEEQWESQEALREHVRSSLYRRVLGAMELSKQPPEVRFYQCSETEGLSYIAAARRQVEPDAVSPGSN